MKKPRFVQIRVTVRQTYCSIEGCRLQCDSHEKMVFAMRSASLTFLFCCALVLSSRAASAAQAPSADKAAAGAMLFRESGCAHCHGANLTGTKKGPSLVGIATDKKWPLEKLRDQILNGGEKMPSFADSLSDDEIDQVISFLRSSGSQTTSVASSGKK